MSGLFWTIILGAYTEEEIRTLKLWADEMESLADQSRKQGRQVSL